MNRYFIFFYLLFLGTILWAQNKHPLQIALLKYKGGGDWYANLETSLPNLIRFCNINLKTNISEEQAIVEVGSTELFNYPYVHLTGHGNVMFSDFEAQNLRRYLVSGGFLHISDNYGLDPFIRKEMKKVFPNLSFQLINKNHKIYQTPFKLVDGLPKVHVHNDKAPAGYGLFYEGKLVCFYDYESDLGDGWEDASIHNDKESIRKKALQMGANIIYYSFLE